MLLKINCFYFTDDMAAQLPTFDELLKETVGSFEHLYKLKPNVAACAPGRVNLIGEHIDYCDGFVLPMVCIL
jgi:galactokinase